MQTVNNVRKSNKMHVADKSTAPNPILRSTSLEEVADRIYRAEALDLKAALLEEIDGAVNDCMKGYTSIRFPLAMLGLGDLFRAVSSRSRSIEMVTDIKYPPPDRVRAYGRANKPGNPVFYSSTDTSTALLEMRPNIGERFVLSHWQPLAAKSPQVREMGLLETVERLLPALSVQLRSQLEPSRKQDLSADDLEKQHLIRAFLARQFTKIVLKGFEYQYMLSAGIAERLMHGDVDGIIYASIATTQSGINVALLPHSLERLYTPLMCREIEVEARISEFQYRAKILRVSERIAPDGKIHWRN